MTAAPPEPSPDTAPSTPPLSIQDLMLWMLGVGLLLGLRRLLDSQSPRQSVWPLPMQGIDVLLSVIYGLPLAAFFHFRRRRYDLGERRLLHQPGHVLLFLLGLDIIANQAAHTVRVIYVLSLGQERLLNYYATWALVAYGLAVEGLRIGIYGMGISWLAPLKPGFWPLQPVAEVLAAGFRSMALGILAIELLVAQRNDSMPLVFIARGTTALVLALLTWSFWLWDRRLMTGRDWLHHVGVVTCALYYTTHLTLNLMRWWFHVY